MTENLEAPQVQETTPQESVEVKEVAPQEREVTQEETTPTEEAPQETDPQGQEPVDEGKPKPIIEGLTYTSQEELVKGVKAKDEYIEKLKADLKAKQEAEQNVYQQLGYQNEVQFKNAQVEQQLNKQYQAEVSQVEQAYNQDLISLNYALDNGQLSEYDYNNKIQELQQLKVDYLAGIKANDYTRRQQAQYEAQQGQQQAFEQQKNSLYETHKEHKELIDLFYDPQPTIEKAIAMKQAIATQAVEEYKASLQAGQENNNAKANLQSSVNVGNPVQSDPSIPQTMKAVLAKAEKDPNWYNTNYEKIMQKFS